MNRVQVMFRWYDLLVGAYYNMVNRTLYVCPLPMVCVRIFLGRAR